MPRSASLNTGADASRNPSRNWSGAARLWALGSSASAEWSGSASFATDYVYRGYSKSRGNPVVQGSLEYGHDSGAYADLGISQVSFDDKDYGDRAQVEFRPYLGWSLLLGERWGLDIAATGYLYDGQLFGRDSGYAEVYAALDLFPLSAPTASPSGGAGRGSPALRSAPVPASAAGIRGGGPVAAGSAARRPPVRDGLIRFRP
jgi:hypothetical protein